MRKLLLFFTVFVLTVTAATFKLYLKDGGFQLVREYKVDGDRLMYYSVERSDWEEIPVDLVDLTRTNAEAAARKETLDKVAQDLADEAAAAKESRREVLKIPRDPGVYRLEDDQLRIFTAAECTLHNSKGRNVVKVLVPMISGKATLDTPGEHSPNIVKESSPEFFLQLSEMENFGIVKLTHGKGVRIVETISIVPVVKEMEEERTLVPTFTKQLSDNGLYKIWPQDPLPQGEYAVVEYTDGKDNIQVWDFRIQ
jgi:DNA-binding transcriptional regulator GbsR (MarR family)